MLLLTLTSAVASCSRLIAYRDNMEGGGPAWTVPGFWVPPLHIERNPLPHLIARYRKLERGLVELSRREKAPDATVYLDDSHRRLKMLRESGTRVRYILADPPYGDSVPFLEFCQIWNCWQLRARPEFEREVVVSDRVDHRSCWEQYAERLHGVLEQCGRILEDDGRLTLTFNNLEPRAVARPALGAPAGAVQVCGCCLPDTGRRVGQGPLYADEQLPGRCVRHFLQRPGGHGLRALVGRCPTAGSGRGVARGSGKPGHAVEGGRALHLGRKRRRAAYVGTGAAFRRSPRTNSAYPGGCAALLGHSSGHR